MEKLRQIVSNLLSNASKFTPEKGNIYIHVMESAASGSSVVTIKVKDTGIGLGTTPELVALPDQTTDQPIEDAFVKKVRELVEQHLTDTDLTVEKLSKLIFLRHSQLIMQGPGNVFDYFDRTAIFTITPTSPMMKNTRTEIPLSKTKLLKLLFFSILFLTAGIWIIVKDPQVSNPVFNNVVIKTLASYGGAIMGVLGIYFFSRQLFDKNPGLVLSDQGIYDNTSAFKVGLIPWSDVSHIYESSMQASIASKQQFITIGLTDPDKYIVRETNTLKQRLLKANAKRYGSPIHISTNGLKTNHKDLLKLFTSYFEQYKHGS